MLDEAGGQVTVEGSIRLLLTMIEFTRRYGDLGRSRRALAEAGLGRGEDVREPAKNVAHNDDHRW